MTAKGCNAENELRRNSAGFKWVQAALCHDTARRLSLILGCSEPLAKILSARGWREPGEAEIFLDPKLAHLGDPLKLPGIRDAADALIEAAAQRRRITLFSDYDVDGITSSALLERLLRVLGARPELFLPERLSEGYGLSAAAAERCLRETRPELLVVLDCGTNSRAEIEKIRAGGVRVIVLDHHEPGDVASPEVLINPKCRDGGRGHVNLCTVGLVFKLCHGLLKLEPKLQETFSLKRHLDFVALGTVADLVPLLGENRILARHGLEQMANTAHPGIRALLSVAGVTERPSTEDCGFRLGPRLNAAGRLESAKAALELLVTEDAERARKLAEQLDEVNRERRQVQEAMSAEAIGLAQARLQAGDRVLVLAREGWHQGVAGIVAAKVSQKFHRPAFVFAIDPATRVAKGSGRSISGFPLMEALESARSLVLAGGGHVMAVGVTVEEPRLESFRAAVNAWAERLAGEPIWEPSLNIDLELEVAALNSALAEDLERLAPHGQHNPPVLIALRGASVRTTQRVGGDRKHLSLVLEEGGRTFRGIFFQYDDRPEPVPGRRVDAVFHLQRDSYRGGDAVQGVLRDLVFNA